MRVEKDYEEFLRLLNRNKVKYCIVGSYAVAFHARPRYTKAIDILVEARRSLFHVGTALSGRPSNGEPVEDPEHGRRAEGLPYNPRITRIYTNESRNPEVAFWIPRSSRGMTIFFRSAHLLCGPKKYVGAALCGRPSKGEPVEDPEHGRRAEGLPYFFPLTFRL